MIYEYNDNVFEWNDNKIIFYDEVHSEVEERYNVIGLVDEVLFVVYTERNENFRIISARKATDFERSLYYGE